MRIIWSKGTDTMNRRRPTGRFFVFMMILLCLVAFIISQLLRPKPAEYEEVISGSSSDTRVVQAVIMRDEQVASMDGSGTMMFIAEEGEHLSAGDEIAYIYTAAYSSKEIEKLESVRQDIRAYHTTILSNIVDAELDMLDDNVYYLARQMKMLVTGKSTGSLLNLEVQLSDAMKARQEYLRQNRREDTKLNSLYEEETKKESSISSWRTVETASRSGVVSFYLDGYEQYLSPDNLSNISIQGIKSVLSGQSLDSNASRLTTNIYRLVSTDKWYVLLLASDENFNPVTGQSFWLQMEGFDDVIYQMTVDSVLKSGSETLTVLSTTNPIGPLLNQRSGKAVISAELSGLYVPASAVRIENNHTGVYIYDGADGSFVPVQVISREGDNVLVTPTQEGTLVPGHYVRVN